MREEKGRPRSDAPAGAAPGTRMLLIPACPAGLMRLAEESIERLKNEHPPRPVKNTKRKRKTGRKSGPIGGGRSR